MLLAVSFLVQGHDFVGRVQYKFIVDGKWRYATDQPAMYDDQNNVNNVLEVQEYVPENLESLTSFEPPPSPEDRCAPSLLRFLALAGAGLLSSACVSFILMCQWAASFRSL